MTSNSNFLFRSVRLGLAFIFILFMAVASLAWEGDGSSSTPYMIKSCSDLVTLRNNVNGGTSYDGKYFEQNGDIDCSGSTWNNPIGIDESYRFGGNYNGGGFKIKNLTISANTKYVGLFGFVRGQSDGRGGYAVIMLQNIVLEDCDIQSTATDSYAGGICAKPQTVRVENCRVSGNIKADYAAGGIVGDYNISRSVYVKGCFADVTVNAGVKTGYSNQGQSVKYCVTGKIFGKAGLGNSNTELNNNYYYDDGATNANGEIVTAYGHDNSSTTNPDDDRVTKVYKVGSLSLAIEGAAITHGDFGYFEAGATVKLKAKANHIIETISGVDASISNDKKTATFTMPSKDVTITATTSEVHTMNVPSGMTLSDPYITIGNVKYYKKGVTYTFTAPENNIIESFTATGAQSSSVSNDKRSASVTIGTANVTTTASLTEVHTVTAQKGITLSEAYTNILGTDYYKYGQKVTFGFSGSGSVVYYVDGKRIEGNSVTLGHENLTVQMGVPYIDENGDEQVRKPGKFTVLTKNTSVGSLDDGWYVVLGDVRYTNSVKFSKDAYLILADGAKMEIETDGELEHGISADGSLTIYGQIDQSGILKTTAKGSDGYGIYGVYNITISGGNVTATSKSKGIYGSNHITISGGKVTATGESVYSIYGKNVTISGGKVTATGKSVYSIYGVNYVLISGGTVTATSEGNYGIYSVYNITISGGTVTATSEGNYGIYGKNVTISGGTVTATGGFGDGIFSDGNIALSWTKSTDNIKASCYVSQNGSVTIADGKSFTDEDDRVYSGTLNSDQLSAIKGKTLTPASIKYIDENGKEQVRKPGEYTLLTSTTDVSYLEGGWYVVQGEVSYTSQVTFDGDAYLILADGAKMEVVTEGYLEHGIDASGNLTIYGQTDQSGILKATVKGSMASGINGYEGVTISGGTVTATSENDVGIYSDYGNVTISGGTVTATGKASGIRAYNDIISLSWMNLTDKIKVSNYFGGYGSVFIADGKSFTDEDGNVYRGSLNGDQLSAIEGKTLTPCFAVTFDPQNGKDPVMHPTTFDENGVAHVAKPADPIRRGFSFLGWFTSKDGDTEFDFSAAITGNTTTAYAKWQEKDPIEYIDENGGPKSTKDYVLLTSNMDVSSLPGGWYVVQGEVKYSNTVEFSEDAYLIFADGAKMEIETEGDEEHAINVVKNLTIYGQSGQSGILAATAKGSVSYGIYSGYGNVTISGGSVAVTSNGPGIYSNKNVTISGGTVTATSENNVGIYSNKNVTITGGSVTATGNGYGIYGYNDVAITGGNVTATSNYAGIYSVQGDITLSLNSGYIKASSFCSFYGSVKVAEGKSLKDENGKVYRGTLTQSQVSAIKDQKLEPFTGISVSFVDNSSETPTVFAEIAAEKNGLVAAPAKHPFRSGKTFLGWYEADGVTEFNFNEKITASTAAYAKWGENALVEYIDENGKTKSVSDYVLLTNDIYVDDLPGGWYVVQGEVSYTSQVKFNGDAYLILADGAKMEIESESDEEHGIYALRNLTIYGQSSQSEILKVTATGSGAYGIFGNGNITISGGNVTATGKSGGIYSDYGNVTISGGNVTGTSESEGIHNSGEGIHSSGNMTISGGNVTATGKTDGIYASKSVTINGGSVTATGGKRGISAYNGGINLSWTNPTDNIKASSYYLFGSNKHVTIVNGKSLQDEDGNVYRGTLNSDQLSAIEGKTLTPAPVNYIDENGNEKSIYEYTVLTSDIKPNDEGVIKLPGGWYVLENSDPNYMDLYLTSTLSFSGDVNLILADDADMKVSVEKGDAINVAGKLTVYGQSNQTGSIIANGGENGINATDGTVVNGGSVKAYGTSGKGFKGTLDIHFKHYKNYIAASGFGGPVTVSGLALTESSKKGIYEGDLDENQVTVLNTIAENSLVLEPCYVVKFDKRDGSDPEFLAATFNKEGVAHVTRPKKPTSTNQVFYGWFTLTGPDPTDENSYTRFRFDEQVTANTEVVAFWKDEISVTFNTDDGRDPVIVVAEYDENGDAYVAKPEVPTREGYTFLEWVDKAKADSTYGVIRKRFRFDEPVTQSTYAYAKWWKNDPVEYVAYDPDEGKVVTKTVKDYTVLTPWTDVSKGLPAEWYIVVDSNKDYDDDDEIDVRFTKQLNFNSETTHIILMDDAQMIVSDDMNSAIHANVLNIYGQSIGSGNLTVNSDSWAIEAGSFNIYGGIFHAFGKLVGIYSYNTAHLYGGFVEVANGNYGIYVNKGDIILDWSNKYFDGYNINGYATFNGGSVIVANGKYFKDQKGHIYGGMLSSNQVMAISQQTIEPLPWKNVGDYAAVQIFEDGNGKKHAVIEGEYDGTDAVNIGTDISVNDVVFNREFSVNLENGGFSTIMLPFDIKAENLTGVKSIFEFANIVKIDGMNTVGVNYVWCNTTIGKQELEKGNPDCNQLSGELKAYTPYMVEMETPTLGINGNVTLKSSNNATNSVVSKSNWVFRGALEKKEWSKEDDDIKNGQIWAFAGSARNGASIGKFVQFGGNNWVNPFRAYLVDCTTYSDASECKDNQPKASQVSRYRFADALAPASSAATDEPLVLKQAAASETASLNSMDIVIVYGDKESDGDKERPTVIGRYNPATGEIRMLPRTKQTYDLKGRRVNSEKRNARGAYYGKHGRK